MRPSDARDIDFKRQFDLTNRVVVITGGCGLIGRSFAEACAQFGACVAVGDIEETDPRAFALDLAGRFGRSMLGAAMDVTRRESVRALLARVIETFGRMDGLVNAHQNKSVRFFTEFERYTDDDWDAIIGSNLKGVFISCQILGGWMARHGGGCIVNMPSTYSIVAPNQSLYKGTAMGCPAAYSASKGGVYALSRYLATYWASKGVRVNMITPHGVWNHHEEQFEKNFSNYLPLGRMSSSYEVAGALVYLLSDASSFVTGHNLVVDGGWTVW
jgi:NAD(P)-dependent dehydrogenase (short-subunit alcohol dehydrogenase family)